MSVHLLLFALDAIGLFVAATIGLRVLSVRMTNLNAQLIAGMCVASFCARLLARQEYGYFIPDAYDVDVEPLSSVLHIVRNVAPGLFMVLCWRVFSDGARVSRGLLALWALQTVLEISLTSANSQHAPVGIAAALLQLLFLCNGLYWTVKGWDADLIERRRDLRWVFLAVVGGYVLAAVLLERLLLSWQGPLIFPVHIGLSIFGVVLASIGMYSLFGSGIETYLATGQDTPPSKTKAPAADVDRDSSDLDRLRKALHEEHVYRRSDLSIAVLAAQLSMPEYRLRRLIHDGLDYRNFNALLHHYRIADACRVFEDREQRTVPILTVALSLGYNSINPFNRAFRELKGMTPSEFRNQATRTG